MLCTDTMPATHHTALEKRERRFDGVRVDVALDVDSEAVADRLVSSSVLAKMGSRAPVGLVIVSEENFHVIAEVFLDVLGERARLHIFGMEESQFSAALPDTDHDFLVVVTMRPSLASVDATNERLIHLDFATERETLYLRHRRSDAVAEIPRGLIGLEAERALNLASGHSFLGFAEQDRSKEPSGQREMRVVEDRVHSNGELVLA